MFAAIVHYNTQISVSLKVNFIWSSCALCSFQVFIHPGVGTALDLELEDKEF